MSFHQFYQVYEEVLELISCQCPCVYTGCGWQGPRDHLLYHIASDHPSIPLLDSANVVMVASNVNEPHPYTWLMAQKCYDQIFFIQFQRSMIEGKIKLNGTVQLINTQELAHTFTYTLKIKKGCREIAYTSTPFSVKDSVHLMEPIDCLEIDWQRLELFEIEGVIVITCGIQRKY